MANIRLYVVLGLSMVLIAGGGVGMHLFFGWFGTVLFLGLTFAILGVMQYLTGGLSIGGGGGGRTASRRRQSKGASGRGTRDDR